MDDFPCTEETDRFAYVGVVYETENIFVGAAGFLLCRHIFEQIRDRIAFRLELTGIKRDSAGCLRPKGKRMVHIVFVKSAAFDFFGGKIFGKLVNDGGYHFHMRQFFRTYIVPGNVPDQALWGQVQCFRLICT